MKTRSTLVVGGGVAGLAAGLELARHGVLTTILEARAGFGGRILTVQGNAGPIELGAEFVHGRSAALIRAIHEAGLSTQAVPERHRVFEAGEFRESKFWEMIAEVINRVDPQRPDCSFADFLSQENIKEPARSLSRDFVMGFDAADPDRISAHALKRAEYASEHMHGDEQLRITEGYAALAAYFAGQVQNHGGRLIPNTRVRRVHWESGNVEMLAEQDGRPRLFSAETAVIAIPLGVFKAGTVKFEPSLPGKLEAIRSLEMGNVVRMVFEFKESSWDDFGFIHTPGEPFAAWWSDARGPILTGWAGGPNADALLESSPGEIETMGLKTLGKMFFAGATPAALRKKIVTAHYFNWSMDPDIRGAYSYIPVNGLDLPKLLAAPVTDTLFFAGEATVADAQTGTVFGALESGLRAANEILDR